VLKRIGILSVVMWMVALPLACEDLFGCRGEGCEKPCTEETCDGVCTEKGCEKPCTKENCDGVCTDKGCEKPCTKENCDGVCTDKGCEKACTKENCDGVCTDKGCEKACTKENCDGVCTDKGCEKPCTKENCDGVCTDKGCEACTPENCNGTCTEKGCQRKLPTGTPWTQVEFSPADVEAVNSLRVFFARKSIGGELSVGLEARGISVLRPQRESDESLRGNELKHAMEELARLRRGFVAYEMGNNGVSPRESPWNKIATFNEAMDIVKSNVDIAFMKLCFADFNSGLVSDEQIDELFKRYQKTLDDLEYRFPKVTFVHATAPLYVEGEYFNGSNTQIERFNKWLRDTYKGKVFDLATMESIREDGTSIATLQDGTTPAMASDWSIGGNNSHLNGDGQQRFSGALIAFLAQVELNR